jgi:hypothetical protein
MRVGLTTGACLALALLVGCTDGKGEEKKGDGLKSGPQVGQGVGIFEPLSVTGPFEGKRQCLV